MRQRLLGNAKSSYPPPRFAFGGLMRSKCWRTLSLALSAWVGPVSAPLVSSAQTVTTYSYDALGRVVSAVDDSNAQVNYSYDAVGNRTRVSGAAAGPPAAADGTMSASYNTSTPYALPVSGAITSITTDAAPTKGSVTYSLVKNVGWQATYTAAWPNYGTDSFSYRAIGPGGSSPSRTIQVAIANPPVGGASDVSFSARYQTATSVAFPISGDHAYPVSDTNPAHGSAIYNYASNSGWQATYTPAGGYSGPDSWTFHAANPGGNSTVHTASVTVLPPPPSVAPASIQVGYGLTGSTALAPSGSYTSLAIASAPTHGSAWINGATAYYTPASTFYGPDSFTYVASGPGGASAPAAISVTVAPPNYALNPMNWGNLDPTWFGMQSPSPTPNWVDSATLTVSGLSAGVSAALTFATDQVSTIDSPDYSGAGLTVLVFKNGVRLGLAMGVPQKNGQPLSTIPSITVTNGDTIRFQAIVSASYITQGSGMSDWRRARLVIRNASTGNGEVVAAIVVNGSYAEQEAGCADWTIC